MVPIRATPPPAMSCFMPWDLAPGGTDQGDSAAGHELLHALGLGAGVVVAITFQKVDGAPDAEACTECDHEGLKYIYCAVKEIHDSP